MKHAQMRRLFFLAAAFWAGWVMSACTDPSDGTTNAQPCDNGVCPLGYVCTTGYCIPSAADETGGEPMDGHGTIRIEVSPVGGDTSIFDGTTRVVAAVNYQSCLQDFYLGNPEFAADGPDGMPIFEAWLYKLCADFTDIPECVVDEINQNLIVANDVYTLVVEYTIGDPAGLAGSEFHVGPLPTSELAGCPALVEVRQPGLAGYDADGNQIWSISTLAANNTAETDQGVPVRVEVAPTTGP